LEDATIADLFRSCQWRWIGVGYGKFFQKQIGATDFWRFIQKFAGLRFHKGLRRIFRQAENRSSSSSMFTLTELERLTELKSKMLFFRAMFHFRELKIQNFFLTFAAQWFSEGIPHRPTP